MKTLKTLSAEWPHRSWHFPPSHMRDLNYALAKRDTNTLGSLSDTDDAKFDLVRRLIEIYERPISTNEQRRWLRLRWARYCRLRRWYGFGEWGFGTEIREIEREVARVEGRIEEVARRSDAQPKARQREAA